MKTNVVCAVLTVMALFLVGDLVLMQMETGITHAAYHRYVQPRCTGPECSSEAWALEPTIKSLKAAPSGSVEAAVMRKSINTKDPSDNRVITVQQLRSTGLTAATMSKLHRPVDKSIKQDYAFKMFEPGTFEKHDMEFCPGLRDADLQPIDEKFKFMFVLGAQKAGTTWLHEALTRHPAFVEASHAYMGGWAKEVRFFNSLPMGTTQDYLNLFPSKKRLRALYDTPTVFLDSSPWYLWSPAVAPRIKQMIPHAKFVIVLRDPVARTVSSYNMLKNSNEKCWKSKHGKVCWRKIKPLLEEFRSHRDLEVHWPEPLKGCNFNETVENDDSKRTWGDCWRCDQYVYGCRMISHEEAEALGGCSHTRFPRVGGVPVTHMGLYAAQIAWWLSFFPPESFVILTREELRDPDRVMPALNKILKLMDMENSTQPFTQKLIGKVKGFKGKYKGDMSEDDQLALKEIADFFEQPNKDLQTLMDTYFPDSGFNGFTPEYTADDVNPYVSKPKGSQQRSEKRKQKHRTRDQIISMGKSQPDLLDTATRLPPGIQGTPSAASSSAFSSSSNPPHASLGGMDVMAGPGDLVAPQGGSGSSVTRSAQNSGGIAENTSGDYAAQELEHDTEARGPGGTSSGGPLMVSGPQGTSSQTGIEAEGSAAP